MIAMRKAFSIAAVLLTLVGISHANGVQTTLLAETRTGAIELESRPQCVPLRWTGSALDLTRIPSARVLLIAEGIWASEPPATGYGLFLQVPEHQFPDRADAGFIGAISFYDVPGRYDPAHPKTLRFDLGPALQQLRSAGRLSAHPAVTVAPLDKTLATGRAGVTQFKIVAEQPDAETP